MTLVLGIKWIDKKVVLNNLTQKRLRVIETLLKEVREFWFRYKKNRVAVVGLIIVLFMGSIGILADYIAPFGPFEMVSNPFIQPSLIHPLGCDDLGRDILSQVMYGVRVSIIIGFLVAFFSLTIGAIIGTISGYFGGMVDELLMRVTEMFLVVPTFFFAIVIVAVLGGSILNIILVITLLSWPSNARLIRAEFLSLKERDFVEAARALGDSELGIILEILPNAIAPVIVNSSLQVARAILLEAGLSFLGLGDPNFISLGYMLQNAQKFILFSWHMVLFPGLVMSLLVLAFNLVGDGLNDALNPRLRRR